MEIVPFNLPIYRSDPMKCKGYASGHALHNKTNFYLWVVSRLVWSTNRGTLFSLIRKKKY